MYNTQFAQPGTTHNLQPLVLCGQVLLGADKADEADETDEMGNAGQPQGYGSTMYREATPGEHIQASFWRSFWSFWSFWSFCRMMHVLLHLF